MTIAIQESEHKYKDKDNDKDKDKCYYNDNDKDKGKCYYNDKDKAHYQSKKPRSFSTNDNSAYEKLSFVHDPYFHLAGPELKRRTLPQIPL